MGSQPKVQTASQNVKTPAQQYSYGGTNMTQAEAQQKYQADMAAWRAPTTTGTGYAGMDTGTMTAAAPAAVAGGEGLAPTHLGVPTTDWSAQGMGAGPALPAMGVLPTAPVVVPRQNLAQLIRRQPAYQPLSRGGGDRSSNGYSGSASGGRGGFGGSSARSGGLY